VHALRDGDRARQNGNRNGVCWLGSKATHRDDAPQLPRGLVSRGATVAHLDCVGRSRARDVASESRTGRDTARSSRPAARVDRLARDASEGRGRLPASGRKLDKTPALRCAGLAWLQPAPIAAHPGAPHFIAHSRYFSTHIVCDHDFPVYGSRTLDSDGAFPRPIHRAVARRYPRWRLRHVDRQARSCGGSGDTGAALTRSPIRI
jgi:hypothetical protein